MGLIASKLLPTSTSDGKQIKLQGVIAHLRAMLDSITDFQSSLHLEKSNSDGDLRKSEASRLSIDPAGSSDEQGKMPKPDS